MDFLPSLLTTSLDLSSVSLFSPLNEYSNEVKPGMELNSFDTTTLEDLLSQFAFSESKMNDAEDFIISNSCFSIYTILH